MSGMVEDDRPRERPAKRWSDNLYMVFHLVEWLQTAFRFCDDWLTVHRWPHSQTADLTRRHLWTASEQWKRRRSRSHGSTTLPLGLDYLGVSTLGGSWPYSVASAEDRSVIHTQMNDDKMRYMGIWSGDFFTEAQSPKHTRRIETDSLPSRTMCQIVSYAAISFRKTAPIFNIFSNRFFRKDSFFRRTLQVLIWE